MGLASAAKKAAAARPATARPSARNSSARMTWRERLRRAIHLLVQATARFRRLLQVLARESGMLIRALFRAPGSLLNLVQWVLSSRPGRFLMAAAASLICITLQCHRPTAADIQLSSSISLLFGMFRLQGSLALQLGPPETCNEDPTIRHQQQQQGSDELRITCPKDLKESIVRFLESQAATNNINHLTTAISAQIPTTAAATAATGTTGQQEQQQLSSPSQHHRQQHQQGEVEVEQYRPYEAGVEGAVLRSTLGHSPGGFAFPRASAAPPNTWEVVAAGGAAPLAETATVEEDDAGSYSSADSAACGGGGFESCCSDSFPVGAPAAGLQAVTRTTYGTAAAPVLSSVDALLPSTPPLGCSPPAKAAGDSADGAAGWQEPGFMDRSEYISLMSYAASYKPSVAARVDSPRAELATHGSFPVFYGLPSKETGAGVTAPVAGADAAAPARGNGGGGTGSGGNGTLHKSPDSILGLQNLGLEGWAKSCRLWESRYPED